MERGQIVTQYFQLRDYLNRANKISNLKTELDFKIDEMRLCEYQLNAIIQNKFETHRLVMSLRNKSKIWERAGFSRFQALEEFCSKLLNEANQLVDNFIKI